jgi:hypothetical protein
MKTKLIEDFTPELFKQMMTDIGKEHHFEGVEKLTFAKVNTPDGDKIYGFYGWKNNKVIKEWQLERLYENVKVCDWLDYYGHYRPKWSPCPLLLLPTFKYKRSAGLEALHFRFDYMFVNVPFV